MSMFFAKRSHIDWATIWMFLTRMFGIPATICIAASIATAVVAFVIWAKWPSIKWPSEHTILAKIIVCVFAEAFAVAIVMASYWMTLYSYGVI